MGGLDSGGEGDGLLLARFQREGGAELAGGGLRWGREKKEYGDDGFEPSTLPPGSLLLTHKQCHHSRHRAPPVCQAPLWAQGTGMRVT